MVIGDTVAGVALLQLPGGVRCGQQHEAAAEHGKRAAPESPHVLLYVGLLAGCTDALGNALDPFVEYVPDRCTVWSEAIAI